MKMLKYSLCIIDINYAESAVETTNSFWFCVGVSGNYHGEESGVAGRLLDDPSALVGR